MTWLHDIRRLLRKITPLRKIHTLYWRLVGQRSHCFLGARVAHWNYTRRLVALRNRKHSRFRVLFPLQELAKWKMQSVIECLRDSNDFEPLVALVVADIWWQKSEVEVSAEHARIRAHFEACGIPVVLTHDFHSGQALSFEPLDPDIVFYQQPWSYAPIHMPLSVSRYALTFYVPYFVPNYEVMKMAEQTFFHRTLYRFCVMNEAAAQDYRRNISRLFNAGDFVATGHPMLDQIVFGGGHNSRAGVVIYAPHWSITHPNNLNPENYSTFLETGRLMLKFAQEHPEINWAFKPHPTLKITLQRTHVWSEDEISDYYSAWARIGEVCVSGPYLDLFSRSRLLITDCGSFLTEYACTGNPVLRLKNKANKVPPCEGIRDLYATYYQAETESELRHWLKTLVLDRLDPVRDKRFAELRNSGLLGSRSAEQVVGALRDAVTGMGYQP